MRKLVVGDIHSGVRALEQVLLRARVHRDDHLIFLGDYVDGWSTAVETIDFLIGLQQQCTCTFLRGNHDALCQEWLLTQNDNPQWAAQGGAATQDSYLQLKRELWEPHLAFYEQLKNYHQDVDRRLYLHAGFTHLRGVEFEHFSPMVYWDRTLWELAKALDSTLKPGDPRFPARLTHYKEIFIGHTPLSKKEVVPPQNEANVWNVDTGAGYKGVVTLLDVATKAYWQSDPVYTLYPEERGRN